MNYKKSMNYDNENSCYVLFNPQKVRIIKEFFAEGTSKKYSDYRGSNYTVRIIKVFP